MTWLVTGLSIPLILGALYLLLRKQRLTVTQFAFICVAVLALIAVSIRLIPQFSWLLAVILPILLRRLPNLMGLLNHFPGSANRASDHSRVQTPWFEMELDHVSGNLDGQILQGNFTHQKLSSLSLRQLLEIWSQPLDTESRQILQAYLDRCHAGWQAEESDDPVAGQGTMSREEALAILGLTGKPDDEEIIDAHRRLVQRLHPDRGRLKLSDKSA